MLTPPANGINDWIDLITALMPFLFAAFAFGMMKYMPTRKEFDMHVKQDDERFTDVKASLNRIEVYLIGRKNGV